MDLQARALLREWDVAPRDALLHSHWSELGLEALMLVRPLVVVGNPESNDLHWLANAGLLLAVQGRWPNDTLIPALCLADQIAPRTRLMAAGAGLIAACIPALTRPLADLDIYRTWQALIAAQANPLAGATKMSLVRALRCDPRKLPSAHVQPPEGPEQP